LTARGVRKGNPKEEVNMTTITANAIVPMGDRVVVRPLEREEVTKSGIVLPDTAKEKPQEGEVIAVGPGRTTDEGKRINMELAKGDRVIFAKYAGTEIKLDETEYLILRESDVLAKLS